MKTITVKGRTFQYRTYWISYGEDIGSDPETHFYEGTETITYKKWGFFGKTIIEERPKFVFKINDDSKNERLSKRWWWEKISEEIDLLNRREELAKGELTFTEKDWTDFCDYVKQKEELTNTKNNESNIS